MQLNTFLRYGIMAGVFLIPVFIPFIISKSMFFPFITGKNFTFRIIVELLFAGWLILAWRDAAYRLKFSWVLSAVMFFLSVVTLADIFGKDFARSFWSNYERMDGLITTIHLVALFVVAASVFNTKTLWERLLQTSLAASVIMSFYGVLQLLGKIVINQGGVRVDAALGNATYFGGYLLFHIFIAAFLFARESTPNWLRGLYGAVIALHVFMLFNTMTRGAILGLLGGAFLVTLLLLAGRTEMRTVRRYAAGFLAAILLLVLGFIAIKNTQFVRNNQIFDRLASISLESGKSRFLVWSIAWEGVKERPIFGWGQDNYIIAFSKHYKSEMYSEEPWFDRAHNVVFDWLISAGFLGLFSYLFIFAALLYAIWIYPIRLRGVESDEKGGGGVRSFSITHGEKSVLTGLFAAYLFHNLFVFDNVVSYYTFFLLLALVHNTSIEETSRTLRFFKKTRFQFGELSNRLFPAVVLIVLVLGLYALNVKGIRASQTLLKGIDRRPVQNASTQEGKEAALRERLSYFEKSLNYGYLGRMESREQLSQMALSLVDAPISQIVKQEFFTLAREEMGKQIEETPENLRPRLFQASLLLRYRLFDEAIVEIEEAFKISDKKQDMYFLLANAYMNKGDEGKALEVTKRAFDLAPGNDKARKSLAALLIRANRAKEAEGLFVGGTYYELDPDIVNAYASIGRVDKLIAFWEYQVAQNPGNLQGYISLSAAHLQAGDRTQAVRELERAIGLFPEFKTQGEYFIREIKAGRNP